MRLAGLALAVAILAGCGSTTASSLEDSAEATSAETSRIEIVSRSDAEDEKQPFAFTASGVVDYERDRMEMTNSEPLPIYENAQLKALRLLGKAAYLGWQVDGKPYWTKQDPAIGSGDPAELLLPGPGSPVKPTDVLERVLSASERNEELGKEDIRGVETTHFRASVDLQKLLKQFPNEEPPTEESAGIWLYETPVPVDLWIDGESRLRRIAMKRFTKTDRFGWTTTLDLFDYGVEADVEPPPESLVISQERFDEMVEPGMVMSGEGEEITP